MELILKTIENDEEYLRQESITIDFSKDNVKELTAILKQSCNTFILYAISPVQIGIPKRMIYIKNSNSDMENNKRENYDEGKVYINPTILRREGTTCFLESCGSIIKENKYFTGIVKRPYLIEVEYYDINHNKKREIIEGFEATVFSHEYDHLNGILHIDKASDIQLMTPEETKAYRTMHPYEILAKEGKYEDNIKTNKR